MEASDSVASILGLGKSARAKSSLDLIARIEHGLPVAALDRVCAALAPDDAAFKYRVVSRATLDRRRKQPGNRLSAEESGRLARLARVWAIARDTWGSDEAARAFLFRPHMMLDMRPPIDLALGTDLGAKLIEEILGRLRHGTAA
jgi:putative toxin-antitoxin system antitoxin component (TIGR02293 family)